MDNKSAVDRRRFIKYTLGGLSALVMSRGLFSPGSAMAAKVKGVNDPGWHGICYLNGLKEEYLVDTSKEKKGKAIPIYIFASEGFDMGPGILNPFGCMTLGNGEEVCYLPYRLQNNVFRGNGTLWSMFKVEGNGLYADVNGTTLHSTGNPEHIKSRDLFLNPLRSSDEIFNYTDENNPNGLTVVDLGVSFNCPIIRADGHPVMDLNPFVA